SYIRPPLQLHQNVKHNKNIRPLAPWARCPAVKAVPLMDLWRTDEARQQHANHGGAPRTHHRRAATFCGLVAKLGRKRYFTMGSRRLCDRPSHRTQLAAIRPVGLCPPALSVEPYL